MAKVFARAQIAFVSTDRDMLVAYLEVGLTHARVTSAAISSGGDRPVEQLSLACEQVRWTFVEPGAREAVTFGWDLLNLKALPRTEITVVQHAVPDRGTVVGPRKPDLRHELKRPLAATNAVAGPRLVHTPSEPSGSQRSPAVHRSSRSQVRSWGNRPGWRT